VVEDFGDGRTKKFFVLPILGLLINDNHSYFAAPVRREIITDDGHFILL